MKTLNCKGRLIDLTTPKVMGIINITPDSFYDGGRLKTDQEILEKAENMLAEGAVFLDVGGYSSRSGAENISVEEELKRVLPVLELILKKFPEAILSVDTFRSEVAQKSVDCGGSVINDISAGFLDEKMLETVARLQVPFVMMHMRGTPETMQQLTDYENVVTEVIQYFSQRIALAQKLGINDLILDPGFGFAKTVAQNFELLKKVELLQNFNLPVLVGLSRKSMIYKTLHTSPDHALNGTTALNTVALMKGVSILRVHDVKEAVECVRLIQQLN